MKLKILESSLVDLIPRSTDLSFMCVLFLQVSELLDMMVPTQVRIDIQTSDFERLKNSFTLLKGSAGRYNAHQGAKLAPVPEMLVRTVAEHKPSLYR